MFFEKKKNGDVEVEMHKRSVACVSGIRSDDDVMKMIPHWFAIFFWIQLSVSR